MLNRETKRKIIFDVILVSMLLLIALSAFLSYYFGFYEPPVSPDVDTAVVVVKLGDDVIGEYPLSVDGEFDLGATNRIKIEGGTVRMIYSTCPGYQDCVERGRVSLIGDKIMCLPNRISVFIEER